MRAFGKLNLFLEVMPVCGGIHPLRTVIAPTLDIFDRVKIDFCTESEAGVFYSFHGFCGKISDNPSGRLGSADLGSDCVLNCGSADSGSDCGSADSGLDFGSCDYVFCSESFVASMKSHVEQLGHTSDNVTLAVGLFAEKFHVPPLRIEICKGIPFMGGLGGSSADPAFVIFQLAKLVGADFEGVREILSAVGNDVCGMFAGGVNFCEGACDNPRKICDNLGGYAVVCMSDFGVSTAECFRRFDDMQCCGKVESKRDTFDFEGGNFPFVDSFSEMFNMLEKPAFLVSHKAESFKNSLQTASGRKFMMTGSGGAFFTLVESEKEAVRIFENVKGVCEFAKITRV